MEKVENNFKIDANERLKELIEERKKIIQEIFELRDKVFEECDKLLAKK